MNVQAQHAPDVKGWCPGARRPMLSGDGWILRVRPALGRLDTVQALGLCDAAARFGTGFLDLTSRANLQIRGVAQADIALLTEALDALGLLDPDERAEARRNILVDPFHDDDASTRLGAALCDRLAEAPPLPAKFGFAVDCGETRLLASSSADIRFERGASGGLILRADGRALGESVTEEAAIDAALDLARWFAATRRDETRMAALKAPAPLRETEPPRPARRPPPPGDVSAGPMLGAAFGVMEAEPLADLIRRSGARALRLTPWRMFILEGGVAVDPAPFLDRPDPVLRADSCAGAPFCPAASVETRDLARRLAPYIAGGLHVSGCAKGCARAAEAAVTLTGRDGKFDLIREGRAGDAPARRGLDAPEILRLFGAA